MGISRNSASYFCRTSILHSLSLSFTFCFQETKYFRAKEAKRQAGLETYFARTIILFFHAGSPVPRFIFFAGCYCKSVAEFNPNNCSGACYIYDFGNPFIYPVGRNTFISNRNNNLFLSRYDF